jgi:tetratricopeptide (TPR) repeat protein
MVERHPRRAHLERFGSAGLSRQENLEVIRHLLSGCTRCRRVTERFLPRTAREATAMEATAMAAMTAEGFEYAPAFAAAHRELDRRQKAFTAERAVAPALLAELAAHPFDDRCLMIAHQARFQSWALCALLLEESREWGFQDPARSFDLAELGAVAATHLDPTIYGLARVNDLAARAWSTLANAEHIRSDFRSAEKGFARAEQLLKKGPGDPLEKAWLLLLKASLRGNQGRFLEAARLLDQVAHIAERNGDLHLVGKALLTKRFLASADGRPEEATQLLTRKKRLTWSRSPWTWFRSSASTWIPGSAVLSPEHVSPSISTLPPALT